MLRRVIGLLIIAGIAWGGLVAVYLLGIEPKLGLDLQGGTSVVLTAPDDTDPDVMEYAVEIMRRRIEDVGGVQEPEISISGGTTVLVQLPGVQNEQQALDAIGRTGRLSFRPVLESTPASRVPWLPPPRSSRPKPISPEGRAPRRRKPRQSPHLPPPPCRTFPKEWIR